MNTNKTAFQKVKFVTEKAIDVLAVLLLIAIFALGLAQVIWRWILNDPIVRSEELNQLIYVWICYLGWAIAERKDAHIRITAVHNMLPKKGQKYMQIFCHLLCILFSVLMIWYGFSLVQTGANRSAVSLPMLKYSVVYAMGPLMNIVLIVYEIEMIIECIKIGPRDYRDKGGDEE